MNTMVGVYLREEEELQGISCSNGIYCQSKLEDAVRGIRGTSRQTHVENILGKYEDSQIDRHLPFHYVLVR